VVKDHPPRNLGLDLVRATEAAALAAGRWTGLGSPLESDRDATESMHTTLNLVEMRGGIAIGEEARMTTSNLLHTGQCVGTGSGPEMDIVVDPIDGRDLVAYGYPGAIAVIAVAPAGALWAPAPAAYMEKIVVDAEVADAIVPECLDAPAAWTLALVARAKSRAVGDLTVFVLDRPRHADLIAEVWEAGAHVLLRDEGDVTGALLAGQTGNGVDLLMGVGGVPEGLIAACALKATGGAMLGRLSPQSGAEQRGIEEAGLDTERILTIDELVCSDVTFLAATGITDGPLLSGVRFVGNRAESNSLVMRGQTRTRRVIFAEHLLEHQSEAWRNYIPGEPFR
jgi:fructose-1,6-bisphosphatase II